MQTHNRLDAVDQNLLRILSVYEQLTPLQLWFELGEDDAAKEAVSEEEIQKRLESLAARGYVKKVVRQGAKAGSAPLIYRVKTSSDTAADGQGGTGET
jgi:hypothetical protein